MLTSWRGIDDVLVEDLAAIDAIRPDANVALGYMVLAYAGTKAHRCCICHVRPVWNAQRCAHCYSWRRRHGVDWDGRLFRSRTDRPRWVRRGDELPE